MKNCLNISHLIHNKQCLSAMMALAAVFILSAALFSQYVLGMAPCKLCIYQRIPYVFAIAFGILAYALYPHRPRIAGVLFFALTASFLIDAGIAGFHAGVEYKWWSGPGGCSGSLPMGDDIETLRQAVLNAPITKCDEAPFTLFNISMAGYNFLTALTLGIVGIVALFSKDKPLSTTAD